MAQPTRNRWRGVPADARTAERRAALVEVAFELVGTDGTAGTTVRRVCEGARLNPRYFYESFPDLDALLVAVFERTAKEAFGVMLDAVNQAVAAQRPDEEIIHAGIAAIIRHVAEDPRRARVLFMEGLTNEALGIKRFETLHELVEMLQQDARAAAIAESGSPRLPSIVEVGANLVVGGMAELLISWVAGKLDVTIDELVDDATALFMAIAHSIDDIDKARRAAGAGAGGAGTGSGDQSTATSSN